MIKDVKERQKQLYDTVKKMIMTDNAVANKFYGPGLSKATKPTQEDISKISQEYALNTLLKAEIMRNKP